MPSQRTTHRYTTINSKNNKQMAKTTNIGHAIVVNEACANIDHLYGPYNSKEEVFEILGEEGYDMLNENILGRVVGVKVADATAPHGFRIVDYQFKQDYASVDDLVLCNSSEQTPEQAESPEIDSLEEVVDFLDGVSHGQKLTDLLDDVQGELMTDEDTNDILDIIQ